jgi:hypothetical protein
MAQAQFTLRGVTGLDPLILFRVPPGARRLFTLNGQGNAQVTGFTNQGFPIVTSTAVKAFEFTLQTVVTSTELVLFRQYLYEQDSNDESLILKNETFRINADELALGNRDPVGSALDKGGINTYFYETYTLLIVPGDYVEPLAGDYSIITATFQELWN